MSIITISLMGKVSCEIDSFLGLQRYNVKVIFTYMSDQPELISVQITWTRRVLEGGLGSFSAHAKENYSR